MCVFDLCSDINDSDIKDSDDTEINNQDSSHTYKPLLTLTTCARVDSFTSDSDTVDASDAVARSILASFTRELVVRSVSVLRLVDWSEFLYAFFAVDSLSCLLATHASELCCDGNDGETNLTSNAHPTLASHHSPSPCVLDSPVTRPPWTRLSQSLHQRWHTALSAGPLPAAPPCAWCVDRNLWTYCLLMMRHPGHS